MKEWFLVPLVILLMAVVLLGGCASVSEDDLAALQNQLQVYEENLSALTAVIAYQIWYDQYYSLGTYAFPDVASFNKTLGSRIREVGDSDSASAWNVYLSADSEYNQVLTALPKDTSTWNSEQYNTWLEASNKRADALGQVGTTLFIVITKPGQ